MAAARGNRAFGDSDKRRLNKSMAGAGHASKFTNTVDQKISIQSSSRYRTIKKNSVYV